MNVEIVDWIDASSVDAWEPANAPRKPQKCRTVGFLVHEDEDCISLASSLGFHDGHTDDCCLTMTIPKVAIQQRGTLMVEK